MGLRIAVDIGGTFTDLVAVDSRNRKVFVTKTLSTPDDFARGVVDALNLLPAPTRAGPIDYVVHGTTVVINAIINERGPKTGMLTTRGFRDVLLIGRQDRLEKDLYNLRRQPQAALISRENIFEIDERIGAQGQVYKELDENAVAEALRKFRDNGGRAVAVCFLNSYRNDAHEKRCIEIAEKVAPEIEVSRSSEIDPSYREFERFSTTSVNAYGVPVVKEYLKRLEDRLRAKGLEAPLGIFTSNGGIISVEEAKRLPVRLVESGPAGGATGSGWLAAEKKIENVIVFDMGGTTAKAALVIDGEIMRTVNHMVAGKFAIRAPMIEQIEIGAGGGSIAWIDAGGLLRVGPHSAGASPGPACYGYGGTEPTLTDALLVLGLLNPTGLAGGSLSLDHKAAKRAIEEKIAKPLGMSVGVAATGIVKVVMAATTRMIRRSTVERGYDPRRFTIVGFGGAGPLVASMLANELDISTVIIPALAGVFSAAGMVNSDYSLEYSFSVVEPFDDVDWKKVNATVEARIGDGRKRLTKSGIGGADVYSAVVLELRYKGQGFELAVNTDFPIEHSALQTIKESFHAQHDRVFGFGRHNSSIELINVRVTVLGRTPNARMSGDTFVSRDELQNSQVRTVYWDGGSQEWPAYPISRLSGKAIQGPLVVDRDTTTIVVPPGFEVLADDDSNIVIRRIPYAVSRET